MLTSAYLLLSSLRFTQFALALAVCGLYGVDLRAATLADKYSNSKWVYAEVVADSPPSLPSFIRSPS
jgi:hypothetical protein